MASRNAFKDFAKKMALYKKKYKAFFNNFCEKNYQSLIGAIAERTPVDFGVLREGWAKHSTMVATGEKVIFTIYNPADYAAHVEYGYHQKPGMILQMEMSNGHLRFVKYLGQTEKYGTGESSNQVKPDKNGMYTIVTRKRYIPGHHMVKDSIDEFKKELPKRYEKAFAAFNRRNG